MAFKYIDADKMRIACTGLTKRIVVGVPAPDNRSFVGVTRDMTGDCLKAVIDKVGINEPHVVVDGDGKPCWEIVVKKIGGLQ